MRIDDIQQLVVGHNRAWKCAQNSKTSMADGLQATNIGKSSSGQTVPWSLSDRLSCSRPRPVQASDLIVKGHSPMRSRRCYILPPRHSAARCIPCSEGRGLEIVAPVSPITYAILVTPMRTFLATSLDVCTRATSEQNSSGHFLVFVHGRCLGQ